MSISSVWLSKINNGNVLNCVALGILAHFAWFPDINGILTLSDVYFDIIILIAVRSTVNFYNPVVTLLNARFDIKNPTFCPHSCIYVFCVYLRTNSDYFPIQH